jgi:hypothetical protein
MSESFKRLVKIQQEIRDLLKEKARLKNKKQKNQLTREEEIDLEGVEELLEELESSRNFWHEQVSRENEPEETSKSFGEADAEWIASVTGINYKYREWTLFTSELDETVVPPPGFQQEYENVTKVFHMRSQAGRRVFLDLFLRYIVLLPEFENMLKIYPRVEMSVESKGPKKRILNGKTDYAVGFGKDIDMFDNTPPRDLHLVVTEAKNSSFDHDDLWQCVAQTATLYKSKKDAGKANCAVWGVLSNAENWKFIHIDEDGNLWRSKEFLLELSTYNQDQVLLIYRLLHYLVKCCYESCTTRSSLDLNRMLPKKRNFSVIKLSLF